MLTDALRAYLAAAREGKYLLARVLTELTRDFDLTPEQAGVVLAQDLREQA